MAKNKSLYEIIYEDKDIVIVNKSSNILSIPDRFREDIPNLYASLQKKYPEYQKLLRKRTETIIPEIQKLKSIYNDLITKSKCKKK